MHPRVPPGQDVTLSVLTQPTLNGRGTVVSSTGRQLTIRTDLQIAAFSAVKLGYQDQIVLGHVLEVHADAPESTNSLMLLQIDDVLNRDYIERLTYYWD